MHNIRKTIAELHVMLKLTEKGLPKKVVAHTVFAIIGGKIQKDKNKPRGAKGKGHWRRNYLTYLAELKKKRNTSLASTSGLRGSKKLKHGALNLYDFSTWMVVGGNTHDLGSFGEETNEITDLHQILEEVLLTERGDGVTSIKRHRRDLFSDGIRNLEKALECGKLKEDLESSM
nr:hypothetical protein [Tanacetum cinerariifolium]